MANLYGGGYQDDLVRGPRRKALLDDMPDSPDGPSPTGGGGLPASPTPAAPGAALAPSPTPDLSKGPGIVAGNIAGANDWQGWVNQAYQQTRGRAPSADELAPWEGYWNDWGSKDPAYFKDRLFNPQNYGGGADGRSGLNQNFQAQDINDPVVNAQREALLQLLQHGNEPIDVASDPILSAQQGQYTQARRTGALQDRGAMAERAAAEGLNSGGQGSGAFDSGVQSINENASRDIAGHQSQLAMNELGRAGSSSRKPCSSPMRLGRGRKAHNSSCSCRRLTRSCGSTGSISSRGSSKIRWASTGRSTSRTRIGMRC
jgi:hypothetical protein